MSIKTFELFHGGVLTKILRADRPVRLTMIETHPGENWETYKVDFDKANARLLIKYSKKPKKTGNDETWPFTFSPKQMEELQPNKLHVALPGFLTAPGDRA